MKDKKLEVVLRDFNLMGYADNNAQYLDNGKGGKILVQKMGKLKYEDEFYGGEPYSGNETIWENDRDIFRCVYYGNVKEGIKFDDVYHFLRKALFKGPTGNCIHRGPECFNEGDFTYTNSCNGSINEFQLVERIFINGIEVYKAFFNGGLINLKRD